jgi:mannosyltransferase
VGARLLLLCALAFALRTYRLGHFSLRGDEAFDVLFDSLPLAELIRQLRFVQPYPPLPHLGLHYWLLLAGRSEFAVRFWPVLAGTLAVPLTYALGRDLFGRRVGLLAATFAAFNPLLLWWSQDLHFYSVVGAAAAASTWLALRCFRSEGRATPADWLLYLLATMFSLFWSYFGYFAWLPQSLVVGWRFLRGRLAGGVLVRWAAAQAALLAFIVPWLLSTLGLVSSYVEPWIRQAGPLEIVWRTLTAHSAGVTTTPQAMRPLSEAEAILPLAVGFGLLFLTGVLFAWRQERDGLALSLVFLLAPLALYYLFSILSRPVFDEKFTLIVSPFFFLLVARGVEGLRRRSSLAAVAALLLIFGGATHALANYFFVPGYAKSPPWRELVAGIHARARPDDLLIFNFPDPATPYYNADFIPALLLPSSAPLTPDEVAVEVEAALAGHPRAWLVPQPMPNWDAEGLVGRWLGRHADKRAEVRAGPLLTELYLAPQTFLAQMEAQEATFGGKIKLLGYDVECRTGRDACQAGDVLELTLYWRALAPMSASYTVFTHLVGPGGNMQGQQDNPPVGGTYPTSEWSPGETIVDKYDIMIQQGAPPGEYTLRVGLYDPASGERLPAADTSGPLADNQAVLSQKLWVE